MGGGRRPPERTGTFLYSARPLGLSDRGHRPEPSGTLPRSRFSTSPNARKASRRAAARRYSEPTGKAEQLFTIPTTALRRSDHPQWKTDQPHKIWTSSSHHCGLSGGVSFVAQRRRVHWRLNPPSPPSASLFCYGRKLFFNLNAEAEASAKAACSSSVLRTARPVSRRPSSATTIWTRTPTVGRNLVSCGGLCGVLEALPGKQSSGSRRCPHAPGPRRPPEFNRSAKPHDPREGSHRHDRP